MVDLKNKRKKKTVSKVEIQVYKPTHIKFNLSFITDNNEHTIYCKDMNDQHLAELFKRMIVISKTSMVELLAQPKNNGLESIEGEKFKGNKKDIFIKKFKEANKVEFSKGKFFIFRLYPNNNPIPARVIGKMINTTFYVLAVSLDHKLYKSD